MFCTHSRGSGQFLTFALECCVLNDVLIELVDRPEKPRRIAANLKHFTPAEQRKRTKSLEIFARQHEFESYEFYDFFRGAFAGVKDLTARIRDVEKVGSGTPLKDYEPLIKFISRLNSYGLSRHQSERGGCF